MSNTAVQFLFCAIIKGTRPLADCDEKQNQPSAR